MVKAILITTFKSQKSLTSFTDFHNVLSRSKQIATSVKKSREYSEFVVLKLLAGFHGGIYTHDTFGSASVVIVNINLML